MDESDSTGSRSISENESNWDSGTLSGVPWGSTSEKAPDNVDYSLGSSDDDDFVRVGDVQETPDGSVRGGSGPPSPVRRMSMSPPAGPFLAEQLTEEQFMGCDDLLAASLKELNFDEKFHIVCSGDRRKLWGCVFAEGWHPPQHAGREPKPSPVETPAAFVVGALAEDAPLQPQSSGGGGGGSSNDSSDCNVGSDGLATGSDVGTPRNFLGITNNGFDTGSSTAAITGLLAGEDPDAFPKPEHEDHDDHDDANAPIPPERRKGMPVLCIMPHDKPNYFCDTQCVPVQADQVTFIDDYQLHTDRRDCAVRSAGLMARYEEYHLGLLTTWARKRLRSWVRKGGPRGKPSVAKRITARQYELLCCPRLRFVPPRRYSVQGGRDPAEVHGHIIWPLSSDSESDSEDDEATRKKKQKKRQKKNEWARPPGPRSPAVSIGELTRIF